jgi:1-acyl-sn-glycerol-3-phosphate acyltransferase
MSQPDVAPTAPSLAAQARATPILQEFPPLFKNRNFLLLWMGHFISALGDRIQFMVALYVLSRQIVGIKEPGTPQSAQLTIAMLSPFVVIGPFAGVLADRLPRRKVMITADFARAAIIVAVRTVFLGYHETMPAWALMALLFGSEFLMSVFAAMFSPAKSALMPNLVHPDQLLRANSLTAAAGTVASLVGFVVGSALIGMQIAGNETVGRSAPSPTFAMYAGAVTFLLSATGLLLMRVPAHIAAPPVTSKGSIGSVFTDLFGGIRYIRQHRKVMQIIGLQFLFWSASGVLVNGITGIVTVHYGLSLTYYGLFMGLLGLGTIAGAAACSLAHRGIPKEVGIAWAMLFVGVFLGLFSVVKSMWLGISFLMAGSFMGAVLLVSLDTLLQRTVPDYVRGRVMGVKDLFSMTGFVGAAVPLAFLTGIDTHIRLVLTALSSLIVVTGVLLVWHYYRDQYLPLPVAIARRFVVAYLTLFKRFRVGNAGRIPIQGPVIFVANHTTAYDPLCMQGASKQRLIQFMMAKEYYEKKPFNLIYRWLKVIPVNRTGNDTASIRTAIRALNEGSCIGMFPEGKISDDGRMNEGRQGVALLALMSGATVVPAYIQGTLPHRGMVGDFLAINRVTFWFGSPIRFDDLGGKRDEAARDAATARIMNAIIALRDRYETDPERRISSAEAAARTAPPSPPAAPPSPPAAQASTGAPA